MTERCITIIADSFLNLGTKYYNKEHILNFTHNALQEICFEVQTATF